MNPFYIKNDTSGDYYSVGTNIVNNKIILEIQEAGVKSRVELNLEQSLHLINVLSKHSSNIIPPEK